MADLIALFVFHLSSAQPKWNNQTGVASTYWPGDGHCGPTRADGQKFTIKQTHIAHRTLPIGLPVILRYKGRSVLTSVRDRGPFGFCLAPTKKECNLAERPTFSCPKGWKWVVRTKRKKGECGYYRGIVDMSKPVAQALGANGLTKIKLFVPPRRVWYRWSQFVRKKVKINLVDWLVLLNAATGIDNRMTL